MQQGMRELIDRLNDYAYAYYVLDAPKVSDKEYDELFDELLRLEADTGIVFQIRQRFGSAASRLQRLNSIRILNAYGAWIR